MTREKAFSTRIHVFDECNSVLANVSWSWSANFPISIKEQNKNSYVRLKSDSMQDRLAQWKYTKQWMIMNVFFLLFFFF